MIGRLVIGRRHDKENGRRKRRTSDERIDWGWNRRARGKIAAVVVVNRWWYPRQRYRVAIARGNERKTEGERR